MHFNNNKNEVCQHILISESAKWRKREVIIFREKEIGETNGSKLCQRSEQDEEYEATYFFRWIA